MEEQNVQFTADAGNTPGEVSPEQSVNTTQAAPIGLTREEMTAIAKEETSKAFRSIQSMQAKQEERIRKEVKSRLDAMVQAGVQLEPEQQAIIAQQTRQQIADEHTQETGDHQPAATQQVTDRQDANTPPPDVQVVNQMAQSILQKAGVTIDKNDPELSMIDQQTTDPLEFLDSMRVAAAAKKERMAKRPGPAATPGATGAGSAPQGLMAQYEKEKSTIARGDIDKLFRLQLKYRNKGLDIS